MVSSMPPLEEEGADVKSRVDVAVMKCVVSQVQFVMIIAHMAPVLFMRQCAFPKFPCFLLLVQNLIFLRLFYNFYQKSYGRRAKVL